MKIAYIIAPVVVISGKSNGIRSQALSWKKGLQNNGHLVDEVSPWGNYEWSSYDVIHIFGTGLWLYSFVSSLKNKNPNIIISPIIDSSQSAVLHRLSSYLGLKKIRLWSPTYTFRKTLSLTKGVFVRSIHESKYIPNNFSKDKVHIVPLATIEPKKTETDYRENFCLHISSITQPRKNVIRLIKAAKKYNFKLVLAGSKGKEDDFKIIKDEIGNYKNIEILGFVSEEKKIELYSKAKVFALPSTNEGVGIVALDAASYGCEIVITALGGPKEYYNNLAEIIDPYSVDDIGRSITNFLNDNIKHQPELSSYVIKNYGEQAITAKIEKLYREIKILS
jgi:glycosyltransferase involved in cell wall biosynthesis